MPFAAGRDVKYSAKKLPVVMSNNVPEAVFIRIDEALFLGGKNKGELIKAFGADIYFDDQQKHCESARHHVATGHVPHGVSNE